jgi:hypothetical protein
MTFENYLQQQHAKVYVGLDDDMPDSFDSWLCDLQPDDFIKHAEEWGHFRYMDGKIAAYKHSIETISKCEV